MLLLFAGVSVLVYRDWSRKQVARLGFFPSEITVGARRIGFSELEMGTYFRRGGK